MLEVVEHKGKWYIRNTETGNIAMRGAPFTTREEAQEYAVMLERKPTNDDLRDKEYDGKRVKRP